MTNGNADCSQYVISTYISLKEKEILCLAFNVSLKHKLLFGENEVGNESLFHNEMKSTFHYITSDKDTIVSKRPARPCITQK